MICELSQPNFSTLLIKNFVMNKVYLSMLYESISGKDNRESFPSHKIKKNYLPKQNEENISSKSSLK